MAGNEQPSEAERYGQGTEPTTGRRTVLQSLAATGAVGVDLGASSVARAQDGYIGSIESS